MHRPSRKQASLLLAFLIVMWGVNWPLTKLALHYAPPLLFAGLRTEIGGLLLVFIGLFRYKELRFKQNWSIYLLSALLNIVLFYGLQTIGLGYLPAGLFSAIVFLQPVLLGIFSWLWLGESMYRLKIIGLILGFTGVATISAGALTGNISLVGVLLALGTALCWAFGTVYMKKIGDRADSVWLVAMQLIIGGILLMGSGSVSEAWSSIQWDASFVAIMLFISIFVIALGWLTYFILIGTGEASKVASFTFLIPLVSITGSSLMMNEPITIHLGVGLLFVLVSILLVNLKPKPGISSSAAATGHY
ncbi:DMT family transporter [Paenibacillus sp.]|uniref:DMT family transporter n=1 Tax=Paenibacillus sp. TaxID=58172 RepID=UPI00356909CD